MYMYFPLYVEKHENIYQLVLKGMTIFFNCFKGHENIFPLSENIFPLLDIHVYMFSEFCECIPQEKICGEKFTLPGQVSVAAHVRIAYCRNYLD